MIIAQIWRLTRKDTRMQGWPAPLARKDKEDLHHRLGEANARVVVGLRDTLRQLAPPSPLVNQHHPHVRCSSPSVGRAGQLNTRTHLHAV